MDISPSNEGMVIDFPFSANNYFSGETIGKFSEIVSTAIYAATNAALQTL